jgi:hypothetical protein
LQPFLGIWLHATTGNEAWLLLPLFTGYVVAPIVDMLLGEDKNNPPEEVVQQLDRDFFYRFLTYAVVPLHFVTLIGVAWWAGTQDLSWWAFLGLAVVAGQEIQARTMARQDRVSRPRIRPLLDRTQPRAPPGCVDAGRPCECPNG